MPTAIVVCLSCTSTKAKAPSSPEPTCRSMARSSSSPARDGARPFDVATHPEFSRYQAVLKQYVTDSTSAIEADLCIVGFAHEPTWTAVWVLWPEGKRILTWDDGASDLTNGHEINLDTDVVPTERDLQGSTYLVTQQWVERLRVACACFGRDVRVHR
jgi:hypothetical protein